MAVPDRTEPNVREAVPFFAVADIERSLGFYVDGLGFSMVNHWSPGGRVLWCRLELGAAAIMLQEYPTEGPDARAPLQHPGEGVSICLQCLDAPAIYREITSRGVAATRPFVGNAMWVTSVTDPDGYRLEFESPTDAPEGAVYGS